MPRNGRQKPAANASPALKSNDTLTTCIRLREQLEIELKAAEFKFATAHKQLSELQVTYSNLIEQKNEKTEAILSSPDHTQREAIRKSLKRYPSLSATNFSQIQTLTQESPMETEHRLFMETCAKTKVTIDTLKEEVETLLAERDTLRSVLSDVNKRIAELESERSDTTRTPSPYSAAEAVSNARGYGYARSPVASALGSINADANGFDGSTPGSPDNARL